LTPVELPFYDGGRSWCVKSEFVIEQRGRRYVLYAGLLDEAHQQGLKAIRTELVQAPTPQNGSVAICLAEVTTEKGVFTGLGDASPENVNRAMTNALIRLAETRAKARALRDAINVSMVALEELSDTAPETFSVPEPSEAPRLSAVPAQAPATPVGHTLPPGVVPLDAARPRRIREAPAGSPGATAASNGNGAKAPIDVAPATPTQLETIAKLARSIGRAVPTSDLTRGAASELITRLSEERYGARRS
jgi:hypothetical protein